MAETKASTIDPNVSMQGHCLCQSVTFECNERANWTLHCHCESCRRATSSPLTTWISVPRRAFRFTKGTPSYFTSSPGVRRGFCPNCGSPLTWESTRIPDEVHFYAVCLADPSSVVPERHVFVNEQLSWIETTDKLPRFATTSRGGAQPLRHGPKQD